MILEVLKLKHLGIYLRILRYSFYSIRFNFHYLPFKQALKFPIIFYNKVKFVNLKGEVHINGPIKRRMIGIGYPGNSLFNNNGKIMWDNRGGKVIFNGTFGINPGCGFRIMNNAQLTIGNNVSIGQNSKISCFNKINIGNSTLISWDFQIMDSDFHPFYNLNKKEISTFSRPITIGEECFIGSRTTILKGSFVPANCVVGAYSLLNKNYGAEKFSLIAGIPASVKYIGVTRLQNESIDEGEIDRMINEYDKFLT